MKMNKTKDGDLLFRSEAAKTLGVVDDAYGFFSKLFISEDETVNKTFHLDSMHLE